MTKSQRILQMEKEKAEIMRIESYIAALKRRNADLEDGTVTEARHKDSDTGKQNTSPIRSVATSGRDWQSSRGPEGSEDAESSEWGIDNSSVAEAQNVQELLSLQAKLSTLAHEHEEPLPSDAPEGLTTLTSSPRQRIDVNSRIRSSERLENQSNQPQTIRRVSLAESLHPMRSVRVTSVNEPRCDVVLENLPLRSESFRVMDMLRPSEAHRTSVSWNRNEPVYRPPPRIDADSNQDSELDALASLDRSSSKRGGDNGELSNLESISHHDLGTSTVFAQELIDSLPATTESRMEDGFASTEYLQSKDTNTDSSPTYDANQEPEYAVSRSGEDVDLPRQDRDQISIKMTEHERRGLDSTASPKPKAPKATANEAFLQPEIRPVRTNTASSVDKFAPVRNTTSILEPSRKPHYDVQHNVVVKEPTVKHPSFTGSCKSRVAADARNTPNPCLQARSNAAGVAVETGVKLETKRASPTAFNTRNAQRGPGQTPVLLESPGANYKPLDTPSTMPGSSNQSCAADHITDNNISCNSMKKQCVENASIPARNSGNLSDLMQRDILQMPQQKTPQVCGLPEHQHTPELKSSSLQDNDDNSEEGDFFRPRKYSLNDTSMISAGIRVCNDGVHDLDSTSKSCSPSVHIEFTKPSSDEPASPSDHAVDADVLVLSESKVSSDTQMTEIPYEEATLPQAGAHYPESLVPSPQDEQILMPDAQILSLSIERSSSAESSSKAGDGSDPAKEDPSPQKGPESNAEIYRRLVAQRKSQATIAAVEPAPALAQRPHGGTTSLCIPSASHRAIQPAPKIVRRNSQTSVHPENSRIREVSENRAETEPFAIAPKTQSPQFDAIAATPPPLDRHGTRAPSRSRRSAHRSLSPHRTASAKEREPSYSNARNVLRISPPGAQSRVGGGTVEKANATISAKRRNASVERDHSQVRMMLRQRRQEPVLLDEDNEFINHVVLRPDANGPDVLQGDQTDSLAEAQKVNSEDQRGSRARSRSRAQRMRDASRERDGAVHEVEQQYSRPASQASPQERLVDTVADNIATPEPHSRKRIITPSVGSAEANRHQTVDPGMSPNDELAHDRDEQSMTPHQMRMAKKIADLRQRKEKEAEERRKRWADAKRIRKANGVAPASSAAGSAANMAVTKSRSRSPQKQVKKDAGAPPEPQLAAPEKTSVEPAPTVDPSPNQKSNLLAPSILAPSEVAGAMGAFKQRSPIPVQQAQGITNRIEVTATLTPPLTGYYQPASGPMSDPYIDASDDGPGWVNPSAARTGAPSAESNTGDSQNPKSVNLSQYVARSAPPTVPKYKEKSNKRLVRNALQILLQGEASRSLRETLTEQLDKVLKDERFIIVLRGMDKGRRDFRALYACRGNRWVRVAHIFTCPAQITEKMIQQYYRFDSGTRSFKEIVGSTEISGLVDAVFLKPEFLPKVKSLR